MRDARLIQTTDIPVSDIDVSNRLRPVSSAAVASLIASVNQLGRMKDEIHVRRIAHQNGKLKLIAGGHRVAMAKELGWKTIAAKVWDCSDDWAALLEIDDNLAQPELSALELTVFMVARKRVYERQHPETKQGGDHKSAAFKNQTELSSFCKSTAEKRGVSERQIRKIVAAGEALRTSDIAKLQTVAKPITLADLIELAKVTDQDDRDAAISIFISDEQIALTSAIRSAAAEFKNIVQIDPAEEAAQKLITAFARAPMASRRRFAAEYSEELQALLKPQLSVVA